MCKKAQVKGFNEVGKFWKPNLTMSHFIQILEENHEIQIQLDDPKDKHNQYKISVFSEDVKFVLFPIG